MNPGDLAARFRERWQALNQTQKIISALVAAGVIVSLFYLGQVMTKPSYASLFTGLEPKDAGVIVEKLKAMKIPYQITDQGKTIQVPESQVYEARIQLASSGALAGSGAGFELFDQNKFGQTDFEQQVGYQRALQEELRRTVVQLEGVEQARVHLVIPQKSVFVSGQGTPSASVALKLKPAARIKPEQVQGISDLFVGSVEGLKPENVHIIDTEGNVLSDNLKSTDPRAVATRTTFEQQKAQREYEKELEKRVQLMLARIVGQNKAVAMVTAELDFDQQQITSTTASNPDNLKISEHTVKETGRGNENGGAVGTDSNITTYPAQQGGSSNYNKEENTTNYQVNTKQETVVKAPGRVKRLSAAVVLNDAAGPADVQKVRDVVSAAIGYDQNRGDQINVSSMAFDDSYLKQVQAEMAQVDTKTKEKQRLITYAAAGGAILALALFSAAFIMWRRRSSSQIAEEEFVPIKEMEFEEEQPVRDDRQDRIREMAKEKPNEVAEILKVWIKD
mgnify:CR=1 FL=1